MCIRIDFAGSDLVVVWLTVPAIFIRNRVENHYNSFHWYQNLWVTKVPCTSFKTTIKCNMMDLRGKLNYLAILLAMCL